MLAKIFSAAVWGVDAYAVEVEVNASPGKPVTVVVGLPDTAVRESCHRVITAVMNSAFRYPFGRVTFNLAPASVKKERPSFDLPMALGIVTASEQLTLRNLHDYWVVGELALTGEVRPVKGALAIALSARKHRKKGLNTPMAVRNIARSLQDKGYLLKAQRTSGSKTNNFHLDPLFAALEKHLAANPSGHKMRVMPGDDD